MKVQFTPGGWEDYQFWVDNDRDMLGKLNRLIKDATRSPFRGLGKPEPLKADMAGWWSRRISGEHRLVYRVQGSGADQRLEVVQCRFHY